MQEVIKDMLMSEIRKMLDELQRKKIGYIDCEYINGFNYKMGDILYQITIIKKD